MKYIFLPTVFEGLYLVLFKRLDLFVFFVRSIHCDFTSVFWLDVWFAATYLGVFK